MMDKRIEEIRARAENASKGPWQIVRAGRGLQSEGLGTFVTATNGGPPPLQGDIIGMAFIEKGDHRGRRDGAETEANAALFAHAREDIPYLLARLAALEAAAKAGLRTLKHWTDKPCVDCGHGHDVGDHPRFILEQLEAALNPASPGAAPGSGAE